MEQNENHAIFIPKQAQGSFQLSLQILTARRWPPVGDLLSILGQGGPARSLGEGRPAPIGGDRQQPGGEGPFGIPVSQAAQRAEKRLLGYILGVLAMPEHSVAEAVHDP